MGDLLARLLLPDSAGDDAVNRDAPDGSGDFPHPDISPLIIDLDGDGIELITLADSTAQFDLDLDGFAERTGWVAADDAFLAYDINGNGVIDDQSELFGNSDAFANGFLSLAALDSNNDGVIDQNDTAFSDLVIWQDGNSDAVTDAGELTSLTDAGIVSIDLTSVSVGDTNAGHTVSDRSTVTWSDATTTVIEDIWFEVDQRISDYILPEDFTYSTAALVLPVLYGYGHIPSTWVSLSQDASLIAESKALVEQANSGDIVGFVASFEQFMLDWAGVADVDPTSRGSHVDARHLAFLEKFYGSDFLQPGHGSGPDLSDPNSPAGASLEAQFSELVQKFAIRFMVQASSAAAVLSILETGQATAATSAVDFLSIFADSLNAETNQLSGSAFDAFTDIIDAYDAGALSLESASMIIDMLRLDLDDGTGAYDTAFDAAISASDKPDASLALALSYGSDASIISGTDTADVISGTSANELIIGGAGNDTITTGGGTNVVFAGTGDDTISSGDGSDTYYYRLGDGNDTITDFDIYNNTGTDTLVFTDINSTDHFDTDYDYSIEAITFADGVSYDYQDIRNQTVSDMKSTGVVTGTELTEHYVHTSGDGSYTITDFDIYNNTGTDTLVFTDINSTDVTFTHTSNDLIIGLGNGETVTINNYYDVDYDYAIESITFADGVSYNYQEVRDRTVSEMKSTGVVTGTEAAEHYEHTSGDGSYTITDFDIYNNTGTDTLVFTDINSTDVTFTHTSNDLIIGLGNGETVTINNYYDVDYDYAIESITFADGVSYNYQEVRDRTVSEMKSTGVVTGTEAAEHYEHTSGDGSYTITDFDIYNNTGTDTFVFTDINSADVTFTQGDTNDLIMTLLNGNTITINNQFDADGDYAIETFTFADGITWTGDELLI